MHWGFETGTISGQRAELTVLSNYLSAALRNLLRNRIHAAINLIGLSVAVAAALLIALYVRDELSYDQFLPGYHNVYLLTEVENITARRFPPIPMDYSLPDLAAQLSVQFPQVTATARVMPASSGQSSFAFADSVPHIRHGQVEADETGFVWVDPSFFRIMPLKSLGGELETALATPDSLVLTRTAARKYFGRDDPVGEVLEVNPAMGSDAAKVSTAFNTPHLMRVTAVIEDLPSHSYLKGEVFGSSLAAYSKSGLYNLTAEQGPFRLNAYTFIRLRPGTSLLQMQQELSAFAAHNSSTSTVYPPGFTIGLNLTPIGALHLSPPGAGAMSPRGDRRFLMALSAVALLIIISASVNFVTLVTAQAARRAIETGVRKAVGALRIQLMIQYFGETAIYVALAMALAIAFAEVTLPQMNALLKERVAFQLFEDPTLLAALIVTTIALTLMAGAYPAVVLSAYRPAAVLKGRVVQGAAGGVVRHTLVVLQFAIMIGLGITAATIWRQTLFSLNNQLRVSGSSILLVDNACVSGGEAFRDRLAALPGVVAAVCADPEALTNGGMAVSARVSGEAATLMKCAAVDYGALEFYGLRPLAGRFFDREHGNDDGTAGSPSIVVTETAMRKLGFGSPSQAIGRVVTWNLRRFTGTPTPGTVLPSQIIGVVPDFSLDTRHSVWPQIFYVGRNTYSVLSVRLLGPQIPEALTAIDAAWSRTMHTSIQRRFLSQSLQDTYADITLQGTAISLGAGLAGLIAALGLFGLAAYTAEQRTKEIGIRKAMGASRADVVRMLLWQFARPVLWANVIAWSVAAYFMHRWLQQFAHHVDLNPLIFLSAGATALAIALTTVVSHALLVARTKPAAALRYE